MSEAALMHICNPFSRLEVQSKVNFRPLSFSLRPYWKEILPVSLTIWRILWRKVLMFHRNATKLCGMHFRIYCTRYRATAHANIYEIFSCSLSKKWSITEGNIFFTVGNRISGWAFATNHCNTAGISTSCELPWAGGWVWCAVEPWISFVDKLTCYILSINLSNLLSINFFREMTPIQKEKPSSFVTLNRCMLMCISIFFTWQKVSSQHYTGYVTH